MSKQGKAHRGPSWLNDPFGRNDLPINVPVCGNRSKCIKQVLTAEQFVWVPERFQCKACRPSWYPRSADGSIVRSATPLHEATVESIILAVSRLGAQIAAPEYVHRCWFDAGRRRCHCGLLDPTVVVIPIEQPGWQDEPGQCPMIAFTGGYNACALPDGHACEHETISGSRHTRWGTKVEARKHFTEKYRSPSRHFASPRTEGDPT